MARQLQASSSMSRFHFSAPADKAGETACFRANLRCLQNAMPEVYRRLLDGLPDRPRPKSGKSADGWGNLAYEGRWLHDPFDPLGEALALAETCGVSSAREIVVFGFGAGYSVEAVLSLASPSARICCIVIDPASLRAALGLRDLSKVLGDRRLELVVGSLREVVSGMPVASPATRIVFHRPLGAVAAKEYASLVEMAEEVLGRQLSFASQCEEIYANVSANLPVIVSCERVGDLYPVFEARPVLLVAPGPSLEQQLPLLGRMRRPLTVALDTSVRTLLAAGIVPDAIVTLDPTPKNLAKLAGVEIDPPLIFFEGARPEFVSRAKRPVYACERGGWLDLCDPFFGSHGTYESCGSVLHAAVDVVLAAGASQVALVGADLALGPESATQDGATRRMVEGRGGEVMRTSESLWRHHRRIVRRLQREAPGRVLDARAFGANIPGIEQISLEEWLETCAAREFPCRWPERRRVSPLDAHGASVLDKARKMLAEAQKRATGEEHFMNEMEKANAPEVDAAEQAVIQALTTAQHFLEAADKGIPEICVALRADEIQTVSQDLSNLLDGLGSLAHMAIDLGQMRTGTRLEASIDVGAMTRSLRDLVRSEESKDWSSVATILEAEIRPVLSGWRHFVGSHIERCRAKVS